MKTNKTVRELVNFANDPDNITVKSESDLAKLAEALGRRAHGSKYDQSIVDDMLKTAKEKFGDDLDAASAWFRNAMQG